MSRYRFIEAQRDHYFMRLLCELMQVPASGYYAWQQAPQQKVAKQEPAWETVLAKVFGMHKRCYGTRLTAAQKLSRRATAPAYEHASPRPARAPA